MGKLWVKRRAKRWVDEADLRAGQRGTEASLCIRPVITEHRAVVDPEMENKAVSMEAGVYLCDVACRRSLQERGCKAEAGAAMLIPNFSASRGARVAKTRKMGNTASERSPEILADDRWGYTGSPLLV